MTGERQSTGVTRREILFAAAGGVAAALAPAGSTPAFAQGATVSGVVFEDRDGSGARTPDAAGVANVLVSNGRDVAVTDAQGRYTSAAAGRGRHLRHQAGRLSCRRSIRPRNCRASTGCTSPTARLPSST